MAIYLVYETKGSKREYGNASGYEFLTKEDIKPLSEFCKKSNKEDIKKLK